MEVVFDKGNFIIKDKDLEIRLNERDAEKLSFEINQKILARKALNKTY